MSHAEHINRQRTVLDATVGILGSSDFVLGVLLGGSHSCGCPDAFSDIDMRCYLRDDQKTGRAHLYKAIGALHPLLCDLWIYDKNALFLFANGVRLDLDFLGPSDLTQGAVVRGEADIIYDPDGVLSRYLSSALMAAPAAHPKWFEPGSTAMLEWFFWIYRQVVCWALRAAQGGDRTYEKLSNAIDSVAEERTRLREMRMWTIGSGRYLEREDPECARTLRRTFPRFEPADVIRCAQLLFCEYRRIGPEYCQKAGADFPAAKALATEAVIGEFLGLSTETGAG
jgi:hypothetical protein